MTTNLDELLPSAKDIRKEMALAEAEKASEEARRKAAEEAENQAFIDQLTKPSGVSDEEGIRRGMTMVKRAMRAGLSEVQVHRFPNTLCTDRGRAINQQEAGFEKTLTGIPAEIFQLWSDYLKPRGYRIRYQIVDFPGGMPGDISITLAWGD